MKKRITEEETALALRQTESGVTVSEIDPKLGVSELRELRSLRARNGKLNPLLANLALDKPILQESLRKQF